MSTADLQSALDRSLAGASPFARTLFAASTLSAAAVEELARRGGMSVATVDRRGRPHAAPVVCGCGAGTLYFTASDGSALLRHLREKPALAFTITSPGHDVFGQGEGVRVGRSVELQSLSAALGTDSRLAGLLAEGWDGEIWSIVLTRIFAS